ncbi:MAG TPA: polyketide synthase, partial [Bryobacteraceae bacterium]|nr:polyketide synthase [Bryobacteraceae bacterium]
MSQRRGRGDIAIIGMACVFPGAKNLESYWNNILRKVDAVSDPPPDWEADYYFDPASQTNDRTYCKRGGYLGALAEFNPVELGIMPNAVDGTEPDHFLALRAAAEALADAGYADAAKLSAHKERTEVIIGRGTYVNRGNTTAIQHSVVLDSVLRVLHQLHPEHTKDELDLIRRELKASLPPFHSDTAPGLVPNIISGRIANRLDLMGSNYVVDAACASSLVAVDLAMTDLLSGRCDMAIAGGVHASTPATILVIFSQLKALSRKGEIRPFDQDADGTLLGEGVGMLVMKRREDAERDGDRIYALIKGIGIASDGRALGLLAPRLEGEELALRRAYDAAGVDPASVELIEAHGTATPVGDAVEVEALNQLFGPKPEGPPRCALGSVKSMISHTMPASGSAGMIKAALALHHRVLPPTLHCENPSPKLHLETSNFYLNTETRPWIHGSRETPRRAGVNAFGFGGINAHAVLEEYNGPNTAPWLQREWDIELFVVSAATREELP